MKPTDELRKLVKRLAGIGLRDEDIALVVEISERSVQRHFRNELKAGRAAASAKVAQTLFQMATSGGNTAATIFWAKCRLGWSETARLELSGRDGAHLERPRGVLVVPAAMSAEEWEAQVMKRQAELMVRGGKP